jgi:hypothetical protein
MLVRRLPLVLLLGPLVMACTPKQDTKQDTKQANKDTKSVTTQPDAPKPDAPKPDAPKPPTTPTGPSYALTPGEAIGPVRVGMSKAEIEAHGYETHPQFSAMTIPISVYYDKADKAETVEISLMHTDKDVTLGDVTIPKGATVETIRELLGDCKQPEHNIGATMHSCRGGAVFIAIGSGNPDEIWLRTGKSATYTLFPGEAIGPVGMGMSKSDVARFGFETHPQFSAMTIPISVYYDDLDMVRTIEVSLTHTDRPVTIGDVTIPKGAKVDEIRQLLGDCQEPEVNDGATMHSCRDGGVIIAIGSGNPDEVWLRVDKQKK